jgi:plastocyanin
MSLTCAGQKRIIAAHGVSFGVTKGAAPMNRRRLAALAVLLGLIAAVFAATTPAGGSDNDSGKRIAIEDDCDPADPAWNMVGGCTQKKGNVSLAEFAGENHSPLSAAVVGHQAWRNAPSYLVIRPGDKVRVTNEGGRVHTFTEVAAFGGGIAPNSAPNEGLQTAPACLASLNVLPGQTATITGLTLGNHRFQCCFHPWMRALIKVKEHGEGGLFGDD